MTPTKTLLLLAKTRSYKKTVLYSGDATKICDLTLDSKWIWTSKVNSASSLVAAGNQGGQITVYPLKFNDVFSFSNDRYVCRQNMTDIVIKHVKTNQTTIIRGKDFIKDISTYNKKFALQLSSEMICTYEECDQDGSFQYQIKEKISHVSCSMLPLTSNHLILCDEYSLSILTFTENVVRTTQFESKISCVRTIECPQSFEYILIGFDDGFTKKIIIDKSFPVDVLKHSREMRFLDLNWDLSKIGFIDSMDNFFVKDLKTKDELLFEKEVTCFAFNNDICDTVCFAKRDGTLVVRSNFSLFI